MNEPIVERSHAREVWVDWMRVAACFMVMLVHATEPFYLGGDGALILTKADAFWSSFFDSFVRSCVPLFIIASSYLQFPLHYSAGEFCRRRAVRILVPFAVWSLVYAFAWGEPVSNLKDLLLNFNYSAGHLWFVYMIVGVYLLMPLLSPWAERVGKKELQVYLGIWFFTTLIPLIRDWASAEPLSMTFGPTGIPRQALFPLWGEASWNGYGMFYYMSGFIGYMLLGLYFRKFVGELSWRRTIAVALPTWLAGFAVTFFGFLRRVYETSGGSFPAAGFINDAVYWETTWCNDTVGVALMAIGWILFFRKINCDGGFYKRVLLPVSKASYGMYLNHMLLLASVSGLVRGWLGSGNEGVLGFWTTPVEILSSATITFVAVSFISVLIQKIPKIGKYIVG